MALWVLSQDLVDVSGEYSLARASCVMIPILMRERKHDSGDDTLISLPGTNGRAEYGP